GRKIVVEMQEARARDVGLPVLAATPAGIGEIVAAIEHHPGRVVEVASEELGGDQRGVAHAAMLPPRPGPDVRGPARGPCGCTRGSAACRPPSATGTGPRRPRRAA